MGPTAIFSLMGLLACSVLAGCSDSDSMAPAGPTYPDSPATLNVAVLGTGTTPEFALGNDVPAVLRNRTGEQASVGALGCTADTEKLDISSGTWVRLSSFRMCIEIVNTVKAGTDLSFELPSPDSEGTYRIVFEAYAGSSGQVTVRSNQFIVR